jgi:hypothetical protein
MYLELNVVGVAPWVAETAMVQKGPFSQGPRKLYRSRCSFRQGQRAGVYELIPALMSTCNLHESISLFGILLTGPIFASCKVSIPYTMELIIDNCQLSKKQHQLEPNCGPQSRAQHQPYEVENIFIKIFPGLLAAIWVV